MSAGQLAALIAAVFFAAGMAAAVFVLLKLAGLISAARAVLSDYDRAAGGLLEQADQALSRAQEQLTRTDAITASMDEVTASMAELSGHVSALAGLARGIAGGVAAPLLRLSAFTFGVRRAVALRTSPRAGAAGHRPAVAERGADAARRRAALPQPGRGRR